MVALLSACIYYYLPPHLPPLVAARQWGAAPMSQTDACWVPGKLGGRGRRYGVGPAPQEGRQGVFVARLALQAVDADDVAFLHEVPLPAGLNGCKHGVSSCRAPEGSLPWAALAHAR